MDAVTVAVDAMGGDRAPAEIVAGAVEAAAAGVHVLLCGPEDAVREQELAGHGSPAGDRAWSMPPA